MAGSENGAGEGSGSQGALPKLTLSQRMLTALPNLQRERSARAGGSAGAGSSGAGDSDGDDDSGAVSPDEVIAPANRSRTSSSRPSAPYRPQAKVNPYADLSVAEIRHRMKYLDDRERPIVLFVGPLIAALDLIITAYLIHHDPALHAKGHFATGPQLAIGVASSVIALLVLVAALYRRRSFVLFALLFCGYGGGIYTMLPTWIVAGWLFVHFNRAQKALITKTGGPGAARQASSQMRSERLERRRKNLEERRRTGRRPPPAAEGPPPNKRYTPPRPTSPRPKP